MSCHGYFIGIIKIINYQPQTSRINEGLCSARPLNLVQKPLSTQNTWAHLKLFQTKFSWRQRLRALQLELHPDKQPEDRRSVVQPLFLLVQREWESQCEESEMKSEPHGPREPHGPPEPHGSDGHWASQASPWEWARRQASAFSHEAQGAATRNAKRETGGRSNAAKQGPKAKPSTKPTGPTGPTQTQNSGSFTFSTEDLSTDSENPGAELQMGSHWTPDSEDDEDSGIVPLLVSGSFENAMHAFTSIQLARRTRGLDAEKAGHPWKQKMDRLEAEAWRLYAKQQGQNGFHQFAIAEHLQKAISLHPDRGELYFDRAMYRVRLSSHSSPEADVTDLSILSRLQHKDFQKVLEDCEAAISRGLHFVRCLRRIASFALRQRLGCLWSFESLRSGASGASKCTGHGWRRTSQRLCVLAPLCQSAPTRSPTSPKCALRDMAYFNMAIAACRIFGTWLSQIASQKPYGCVTCVLF